jgi:hypothetical protein
MYKNAAFAKMETAFLVDILNKHCRTNTAAFVLLPEYHINEKAPADRP